MISIKKETGAFRAASHTHTVYTVVQECCKGDDQSQWRRVNFDPPPPLKQPIFTKIRTDDYVGDIYHPTKFYPNWIRGFVPRMHDFAPIVYSAIFFGSIHQLQPRRHHGHGRKIRQRTRFCARMCLLWIAKPKFNIYTPFCPKTAILTEKQL